MMAGSCGVADRVDMHYLLPLGAALGDQAGEQDWLEVSGDFTSWFTQVNWQELKPLGPGVSAQTKAGQESPPRLV